jgi:hypothetical protein
MKISFREMRDGGVRGLLFYCPAYHCSHSVAVTADACRALRHRRFVCKSAGARAPMSGPDLN